MKSLEVCNARALTVGQPQGPPLLLLTDEEIAEYLWTGENMFAWLSSHLGGCRTTTLQLSARGGLQEGILPRVADGNVFQASFKCCRETIV